MKTLRFECALVALLISSIVPLSGNGQERTWSIDIDNGRAQVNGVAIPAQSMPKSLVVDGMRIHFELPAVGNPIVVIGDAIYAIEKDKIREATPEEIEKYGVIGVASWSDTDALTLVFNSLREIQRSASMAPSEQVQANVRGNALRASQMVAALPHLEMRSYWNEVRENDDALYQALVEEAQVEREVAGLVEMIRQLPDGKPRDKAVADLREQLVALFDMKQANRKDEIVELEAQLETLTKRMVAREEMKAEIVDHRMRELLGPSYR